MRNQCGWRVSKVALAPLLAVCLASPAGATRMLLSVWAPESWIEIGASSQVSIELTELHNMPLVSQVGIRPGVGAAVLPDGSVSNGLRTNLTGTVFLDVTGDQLQFLSERTLLEPIESGLWLPGALEDWETPAGAQAGVAFSDVDLGLEGNAALRQSFLTIRMPNHTLTLTDEGGGVQSFTLTPAKPVTYRFATGHLDWDLGLTGASASKGIPEALMYDPDGTGALEDLGGGQKRLTLPFDFDLVLTQATVGGPIPTQVTLHLAGELVAYAIPIPEPGTGLLLGSGIAIMAWARGHRRRSGAKGGAR